MFLFSGILHDVVHTVVLVVTVGQVDDGHRGVGPHGDGGTHQGPGHGPHLQLQDGVLHHTLAIPPSCKDIVRLANIETITDLIDHYTITNNIDHYK